MTFKDILLTMENIVS